MHACSTSLGLSVWYYVPYTYVSHISSAPKIVCCVIPSPILLVRTSFHTVFSCDNNSVFITLHSEHQQLFWWHVSNKAPSAASMYTAVYSYMCRVFLGGLGCFPLLYVLTSCVLRHPVSYFVSAYLVSYCLLVLLVRQQQLRCGEVRCVFFCFFGWGEVRIVFSYNSTVRCDAVLFEANPYGLRCGNSYGLRCGAVWFC